MSITRWLRNTPSMWGYSSIADMQKAMSQQYLYDSFLISKVSDYLSDKNNMVVKDATEATTAAE